MSVFNWDAVRDYRSMWPIMQNNLRYLDQRGENAINLPMGETHPIIVNPLGKFVRGNDMSNTQEELEARKNYNKLLKLQEDELNTNGARREAIQGQIASLVSGNPYLIQFLSDAPFTNVTPAAFTPPSPPPLPKEYVGYETGIDIDQSQLKLNANLLADEMNESIVGLQLQNVDGNPREQLAQIKKIANAAPDSPIAKKALIAAQKKFISSVSPNGPQFNPNDNNNFRGWNDPTPQTLARLDLLKRVEDKLGIERTPRLGDIGYSSPGYDKEFMNFLTVPNPASNTSPNISSSSSMVLTPAGARYIEYSPIQTRGQRRAGKENAENQKAGWLKKHLQNDNNRYNNMHFNKNINLFGSGLGRPKKMKKNKATGGGLGQAMNKVRLFGAKVKRGAHEIGRKMSGGAMKREPSAYNIFVRDNFQRVNSKYNDPKATMVKLGEMWQRRKS